MAKGQFAPKFKEEAVMKVIEREYTVADVAKRLGLSVQSLHKWVKGSGPNATKLYEASLSPAQEERDILKSQLRTSRKSQG